MAFGRLDKPAGHQPISDINVTPLVDVMLVLLVIFIISAPLMASRLEMELPEVATPVRSDAVEDEAYVTVALDAQGQAYWDDQPLSDEQLSQRMTQAAQVDRRTEVRLRADQRVPHGRVMQLMAMAQQAGLARMGFVTDPSARSAAPEGGR
ncbi:MAG: ExbD/TolR family protein [Gammaproteobacteria bacterium]